MNLIKKSIWMYVVFIGGHLLISTEAQLQVNDTEEIKVVKKSEILSRRKRFIIFPEGSSLQLVFCTTYAMIFRIGDIFLYGSTAALAWELPQDPYSPFNHKADPLHRRVDTKVIYYTNEDGQIIDKKPYHRKPIVNPAFAKRSVDQQGKKGTFEKSKIDRKQMHALENKRAYLNGDMMQQSVEFHRSSRASLYQKIETMLHGLGVNGKHCVLKSLCLVGQTQDHPQGMFFQEIMRAVFTLPRNSVGVEDKHAAYDAALSATGSCDELYPEFLQTVISENVIRDNENNTTNEFHEENEGSRALSRRKRFVIFPDGSSLQLVFCCQTMALIPIGDIFLFGSTLGLAWNLPTDPSIFTNLKEYERPLRRNDVVKTINYLDEDGHLIAKVPYKKRIIVNPAFAKRSIEDDDTLSFKEKLKLKIDRKKMHERHLKLDYLKAQHLDKNSIEFHRSNRVDLYEKIEKLLSATGRDGRQCVLYRLCEAAKRPTRQGTFIQEFFRAVFTLPKGEEFQYDELNEYDTAHVESDDCSARYPGCEDLHESISM
uniref:SFRICE_007255 n=1 Tax=Spodoptera frugiperda TaxID=7108 RepID=A0A2H1WAJ8_SPOFR